MGENPSPRTIRLLGGKGGYFEKLSKGSKTLDMTCEGLGEMFGGDFADVRRKYFANANEGPSGGSSAQIRER